MPHGETMCGLEKINEWLGVIDDTWKNKRGHMGAMCHTPKEGSSCG